jgi:magnesium chelatase subunit D
MRPLAFDDAIAAARQLAAERIPCVLIDTSPRAREEGARLAVAMGARYVPLPYVEAASVRDAVRASVP